MKKNTFASALKFRVNTLPINDFEREFGFNLPPVYRSFISDFEDVIGEIYIDNDGEFQTLTYFEYYSEEGKNLQFEDFLPIENTFKYAKNNDLWIENGVIPITKHSHGGCIVLGCNEDNLDQLFFENGGGLEFIENNVYEFIKNLQFTVEDDSLLDKIYKNFGEDFWRIKQ